MIEEEAVAKLDAIDWGADERLDVEAFHLQADDILLEMVPKPVADAYERCRLHFEFWYA